MSGRIQVSKNKLLQRRLHTVVEAADLYDMILLNKTEAARLTTLAPLYIRNEIISLIFISEVLLFLGVRIHPSHSKPRTSYPFFNVEES